MYDFECLTIIEDLNTVSACSPDDDEPCYPFASCIPEHDCSPW